MKKTLLMMLTCTLCLGAFGCDKEPAAAGKEAKATEAKGAASAEKKATPDAAKGAEKDAKKGAEKDAPTAGAVATVTVSKEGSKFDPPVEISKMPAGAYYCDMGTVHYARMDKGDNKCTSCGMQLKHKAAGEGGAAAPADAKKPDAKSHDHAGHDHAGHEH